MRRLVEEAHQSARDILDRYSEPLHYTSEILLKRETIEREQFIDLLAGKSEEEVFGPDEPIVPRGAPPAAPEVPARQPDRAPKPLPRPGLAGGSADIRGLEQPEKPDIS